MNRVGLAFDDRLEAGGDELTREDTGVASPQRKQTTLAGCCESRRASGADVLEEEVTKGDSVHAGQRW
jgi:hypothetical protein